MHRPDTDGQKEGCTCEQQTMTGIRRAANTRSKAEASITSQNRDHHRERDEIGIVSFEHDLLGHLSPRMTSSRRQLIRPLAGMTTTGRFNSAKYEWPDPGFAWMEDGHRRAEA